MTDPADWFDTFAKSFDKAEAERPRDKAETRPAPVRRVPDLTVGNLQLEASARTFHLCGVCDKGIPVGRPVVIHTPSPSTSTVSWRYHPDCIEVPK